MPLPWLVSALSLLAFLGGCKSHGSVMITLELPAAQELNPMADPRLASFSLVVSDTDGNVQKINTEPYAPGVRQVDIGELPVGDIGRLTLVGYSDANQVLAYGEASGIAVGAYDDILVSLPFRKPYTYMAGGPSVSVFDTTQAHSADVVSPIEINSPGQTTSAVATTPDGRYVLAAVADPATPSASKLLVFNTGQHTEAYRVPLNHSPDFLSVSHDGHWAILSATDASRITVVDLQDVFADVDPALTTRDIVFAAPKRAAFVRRTDGRDLAVVLQNSLLKGEDCLSAALPSTLSVIDLSDGNLLNSTFFETTLADVASRPGDSLVYAAEPCQQRVATFDTNSYQVSTLVGVQSPTSLIVKDDLLWIGREELFQPTSPNTARILIDRVNLNTLEYTPVVTTPFLQEGLVVREGNDQGASRVVLRANPLIVQVYHLSVPPGGTRISALVWAGYFGAYNPALETPEGDLSEVLFISYSYVGLDTNTGEIRRRFRAGCLAFKNNDLVNDECCEALEPFEAPPCTQEFVPEVATSLFGVP